jgi:hypothetical protein
LNAERDARNRIGHNLEQLDDETLVNAGLQIPDMKIEDFQGRQRLILKTERPVVPAFKPGASLRLSREDDERYQSATYFGRNKDTVVFELDGHPARGFLDPSATYEATRTLSTSNFPRDLLGQLDFAQRSGVSPSFEHADPTAESGVTLTSDDLGAITEYLDCEGIYVDVPVRRDRPEILADLVELLTTASYSVPGESSMIPADEQRVLVLSGTPTLTDILFDRVRNKEGAIRMDGFADDETDTVTSKMGGHEIYESLTSSRIIVSSLRYALADHVFHAMESGDATARPHSEQFFDVVVLVGAEALAEPQFHFLRTLCDRIAAIGDVHREGPELVSGEARESPLGEAYFSKAFNHYASVDSTSHQSLQVPAEITEPMVQPLRNLSIPINEIPGTVDFVDVGGSTSTALSTTTIEHQVPCEDNSAEARFLRLEPVESVDALQIVHQLNGLRALDANELTIRNRYTIQDIRYEVLTNKPIKGSTHKIEVNIPVESTPYLHRRLTRNNDEVVKVRELCEEIQPDKVITPFVAHANALHSAFAGHDIDIPVVLSSELDGSIVEEAVVSIAVADENRIVTPPVSEAETLYSMLNSAQNITIVGDQATLERNSVFKMLIESN